MRKQVLIAGGVVLLLLIFVASTVRLFRKNPQTVCSKFIAAVQKNDADKAYALFAPSTQSTVNRSAWTSQVRGFSGAYGSGKLSYVSEQTNTPLSTNIPSYDLSYAVHKTNGSVYNLTCSVIKNQVTGYSSQLQI